MRHVTAKSQEQLLLFLVAIPEQTKFETPYVKGVFMNFILMKLSYVDKTTGEKNVYEHIYEMHKLNKTCIS